MLSLWLQMIHQCGQGILGDIYSNGWATVSPTQSPDPSSSTPPLTLYWILHCHPTAFSSPTPLASSSSPLQSSSSPSSILWEIYYHCSEVFLHLERKFGTVRSGQNYQKSPQKLKKKNCRTILYWASPLLTHSASATQCVTLWPISHFISIWNKTF